jgi:hypothetical protein
MVSEIELCRELWKYRSKQPLPQIAHLRCRKWRCVAIGKPTLFFVGTEDRLLLNKIEKQLHV